MSLVNGVVSINFDLLSFMVCKEGHRNSVVDLQQAVCKLFSSKLYGNGIGEKRLGGEGQAGLTFFFFLALALQSVLYSYW